MISFLRKSVLQKRTIEIFIVQKIKISNFSVIIMNIRHLFFSVSQIKYDIHQKSQIIRKTIILMFLCISAEVNATTFYYKKGSYSNIGSSKTLA
jgi:hypothetical protein